MKVKENVRWVILTCKDCGKKFPQNTTTPEKYTKEVRAKQVCFYCGYKKKIDRLKKGGM